MTTGRVAVLRAYHGEFELREYPVPDPAPGAILVKLTRAGICGSDLHIWRGKIKEVYGALPKDLTFGHEMCGRVARLGAGVTIDSLGAPLHEGDRISEGFQQADWLAQSGDPTRISRAAVSMDVR